MENSNELIKYLDSARKCFDNKEYDKAENFYSKAIQIDDKCVAAYIGLGNISSSRDESFEKALENYNKAIRLDEKNAEAYKMRGCLYYEIKFDKYDSNEAINDFTKAIELNVKYEEAYFERGKVYFYFGSVENALCDLDKAIEYGENYTLAYILRGDIRRTKDEYNLALKDYDKAIELDENNFVAYLNRGHLHYDQKKYEFAEKDYTKATSLNDKSKDAFIGLGNVFYDTHKLDWAEENYKKAIELNDEIADIYYYCGRINYEKGGENEYQTALNYFEKAKELYKKEDAKLYESFLDERIDIINGMLAEPTEDNKKLKQLMKEIDKSDIKKSIEAAEKLFLEFIAGKEDNSTDLSQENDSPPEFVVLRRWNSYTPIISDKEISKGGGYFFKTHDYGIVIDPGFNFIDNFMSSEYYFRDIDHILITHAHNDHTADLESILTLLHKYNAEILGDPNTLKEDTIVHEVFSEIRSKKERVKFEDTKYIEDRAKEKFKNSKKRKRIRIYMTASTFKKFTPMLSLHNKEDYDVVIIKADDTVPILQPNKELLAYSKDLEIKVIKAKHDDMFSDRDSVGFIIKYEKFVLVYTGDTGFSEEIREQYLKICDDYSQNNVVLLAHLGGFKDCEKTFDASKDVKNNSKAFYKNHLGRLGLAKLVEALNPKICIVSEFGEEFRNKRKVLTDIYQDVYGKDTFFIPADIGLRINTNNEISLIDGYISDGTIKKDKKTKFYPCDETNVTVYELESEGTLIYYNKNSIKEGDLIDLLKTTKIRHY